jgi:hypothetical protein
VLALESSLVYCSRRGRRRQLLLSDLLGAQASCLQFLGGNTLRDRRRASGQAPSREMAVALSLSKKLARLMRSQRSEAAFCRTGNPASGNALREVHQKSRESKVRQENTVRRVAERPELYY